MSLIRLCIYVFYMFYEWKCWVFSFWFSVHFFNQRFTFLMIWSFINIFIHFLSYWYINFSCLFLCNILVTPSFNQILQTEKTRMDVPSDMLSKKTPEWINSKKSAIREGFELFDREGTGSVVQEEVSSLFRYLGIYPSERTIVQQILPEIQVSEEMNEMNERMRNWRKVCEMNLKIE